ncbi:MAG: ABC transporter substrate-binding protein [Bacteroidota bacterium]
MHFTMKSRPCIFSISILLSGLFISVAPAGAATKTLEVMTYQGAWFGPYVEQRIKDFETAYPEVDVKFYQVSNLPERIIVESAGGVKRDVYLMGSIIGQWAHDIIGRGLTRDLGTFFKKEKDIALEDFYPPLVEAFTYKGRFVAVPIEVSTQATYVNKTILDEAGIPVPPEGWDWNEMLKIARSVTKDTNNDGVPERWGFSSDGYGLDYLGAGSFLWANGADIVDRTRTRCTLDAPEAVEALQFYYDLHYTHKVAVRPSDGAQWVRFWEGRVAIWESMSWNIAYNRQNAKKDVDWDIVPSLRSPRTGKAAPLISGGIAGISSTSTNPELAWEFIKFVFLSDESQQRIAKLGMLPPRMKFGNFYVRNVGQPPANIRPVLENAMHGGRTPVWFEDPEVDRNVWSAIARGWEEVMIAQQKSVYDFVQTIKPLVDTMLKK